MPLPISSFCLNCISYGIVRATTTACDVVQHTSSWSSRPCVPAIENGCARLHHYHRRINQSMFDSVQFARLPRWGAHTCNIQPATDHSIIDDFLFNTYAQCQVPGRLAFIAQMHTFNERHCNTFFFIFAVRLVLAAARGNNRFQDHFVSSPPNAHIHFANDIAPY